MQPLTDSIWMYLNVSVSFWTSIHTLELPHAPKCLQHICVPLPHTCVSTWLAFIYTYLPHLFSFLSSPSLTLFHQLLSCSLLFISLLAALKCVWFLLNATEAEVLCLPRPFSCRCCLLFVFIQKFSIEMSSMCCAWHFLKTILYLFFLFVVFFCLSSMFATWLLLPVKVWAPLLFLFIFSSFFSSHFFWALFLFLLVLFSLCWPFTKSAKSRWTLSVWPKMAQVRRHLCDDPKPKKNEVRKLFSSRRL